VATAIGLTDFDVINTAMVADGTGLDQVLDTVHVAITHDDSTASSIQVVYKTANGESSPQTITFSSSDTRSNVIASVNGVTYTSGDIFDSKQMQKIQVWIKQVNNCHKLAPTERWSGTTGSKTVLSSVCKKMFYKDDQSLFKSNGAGVEAAFEGVFSNKTWTTNVLSEAEYVYSTKDGEVLVKAKANALNEDGTTFARFYFFNLSPDLNNNNELRSRGNGYDYEVHVSNVNNIRYYPYSSGYDFTFSGYGFDIPTQGNNSGNTYTSPVQKAEVTSPNGDVTHLYNVSSRGRAWLSVCVSKPSSNDDAEQKCADSPYKVINAKFFNRDTNLPEVPPDKDTLLKRTRPSEYAHSGFVDYGATNGQLTNSQIKNLPALGTYTVKLTLMNGEPRDLKVPFYGRPKTHEEMIKSQAAGLFPSFKTSFLAGLFRSVTNVLAPSQTAADFNVYKNVFPLKVADNNGFDVLKYFDASWTGLAQWIYLSGATEDWTKVGTLVDGITVKAPTSTPFGMRTDLSPTESSKKIYCSNSSTYPHCDSSGTFRWFHNSYFGNIFYYMEIGNYFSDFGVNITAYGFTNFEDSGANPYKPQ
jgi:hypothetical protein